MEKRLNILAYVECDSKGDLPALSLEALQAAKDVAEDAGGGRVSALMIGSNLAGAIEALHFHSVDVLYIQDHEALKNYSPQRFFRAFEKAYRLSGPDLAILGNSKNGLDLAARAAAHLDIPLITDCVEIQWDQAEITFVKPVYSNNVLAVYGAGNSPCIATIRSKSVPPSERSSLRKPEIIDLGPPDQQTPDEYEVLEKRRLDDGSKSLADAELIVAGGRGIGGPEGFSTLQTLAALMSGKVGASRPPCDLGWISPDAQIGITGSIVSPSVYFAVGLSGSFQHMAGMSGSKTIVAINSDPNANIFKIADYGVVGEYEPVLTGLMEAIG
jgi:electron transfer flavoprotein alpha subunit